MANNLGSRLAAIANKHSKLKNWRATLKNKLAAAGINGSREPVYSMNSLNSSASSTKKNCGPKPKAWLNAKTKNPAYAEWTACSAAAAGGKRKSRSRSKKSRRATRRKR